MLLASHVVSASAPLTLLPPVQTLSYTLTRKKTTAFSNSPAGLPPIFCGSDCFMCSFSVHPFLSGLLVIICSLSLAVSSSLHRAAVTFSFFYALAITLLQRRDLCTFAVQACQGQRQGLEPTSLVFYFKNCQEAPYHALLFWIFLHALFNQRGSFDRAAPYLTQASRKSAQIAEPGAGDQPQHGRESQEFKQKKKKRGVVQKASGCSKVSNMQHCQSDMRSHRVQIK